MYQPSHPATWWYRLASHLFPSRVREVPEATDPSRIVLRQVALFPRNNLFAVYLQQFAGVESVDFVHSHQFRRTFALGLWGSYVEERLFQWSTTATFLKRRVAPYAYAMDQWVEHRVGWVSPGHTSLFFGWSRDPDLKFYRNLETGIRTPGEAHIVQKVVLV